MNRSRTGSVSILALGAGLATALAVIGYFKSEEQQLLSQIPIPTLGQDYENTQAFNALRAAVIGEHNGVQIHLEDGPIHLDADRFNEHVIVRTEITDTVEEETCFSMSEDGWMYFYDMGENARIQQADNGEIDASEIFPMEHFYLFNGERTGVFSHYHHDQNLEIGDTIIAYIQSRGEVYVDCGDDDEDGVNNIRESEGSEDSSSLASLDSSTSLASSPLVSSASSASFASSDSSSMSSSTNSENSNTEPTSSLLIQQIEIDQLDTTAVENEQAIPLLRFTAAAVDTDIFLHGIQVQAGDGDIRNITNLTLRVDADPSVPGVDLTLQSGVQSGVNARVTLDNFQGGGFAIQAGDTVLFEIQGDVPGSLINNPGTNEIQLELATDQDNYIQVETLADGTSITGIRTNDIPCATTCGISVATTEDNITWNLIRQGSLFVTRYDGTPEDPITLHPHHLLAGSETPPLLRLALSALGEDIDVTDIRIYAEGSQAQSIEHLVLRTVTAIEPFAVATIAGCGGDLGVNPPSDLVVFCANMEHTQLLIREHNGLDHPEIVHISALLKTDQTGAERGEQIQLSVRPNVENNTFVQDPSNIVARGHTSSNNLSPNDGDTVIDGETFIGTTNGANVIIESAVHSTVFSKITQIGNGGPARLNLGTDVTTIGEFTVTAADHSNTDNGSDDAVIDRMTFTISAKGVHLNPAHYKIYNRTEQTDNAKHTCTAPDEIGEVGEEEVEFTVVCEDLVQSIVNTEIDNGGRITLVLEADVMDITGLDSVIQTHLDNWSTHEPHTTRSIEWIDQDQESQQRLVGLDKAPERISSTVYSGPIASVAVCGNGIIETPAETCDDGNDQNEDGCDDQCTEELLYICTGEPSVCTIPVPNPTFLQSSPAVCGDLAITGNEDCEDGNEDNGDGCDENCMIEPLYTCTGLPSICTIPVPEITAP